MIAGEDHSYNRRVEGMASIPIGKCGAYSKIELHLGLRLALVGTAVGIKRSQVVLGRILKFHVKSP